VAPFEESELADRWKIALRHWTIRELYQLKKVEFLLTKLWRKRQRNLVALLNSIGQLDGGTGELVDQQEQEGNGENQAKR
jgi:hypothetical protein